MQSPWVKAFSFALLASTLIACGGVASTKHQAKTSSGKAKLEQGANQKKYQAPYVAKHKLTFPSYRLQAKYTEEQVSTSSTILPRNVINFWFLSKVVASLISGGRSMPSLINPNI